MVAEGDGELLRAVESGDERAALVALRARLAAELEVASGREVAPLTGRLLEVMARVRELDAVAGRGRSRAEQLADTVARKRARGAPGQAGPAVRDQRRRGGC